MLAYHLWQIAISHSVLPFAWNLSLCPHQSRYRLAPMGRTVPSYHFVEPAMILKHKLNSAIAFQIPLQTFSPKFGTHLFHTSGQRLRRSGQ